MLTSFFSTTKNTQRLVLLMALCLPVFFIDQPLFSGFLSLFGFVSSSLLLEFFSVRFGALSRTNSLYWLIAGACFYGGGWFAFDLQFWLGIGLLSLYIGAILNLSTNGVRRDVVFATGFLGFIVVYMIPLGWLMLFLAPLAMLQWQEYNLRKWWLLVLGMGSFSFLFWTATEILPWKDSTLALAPRTQDDWRFVLIFLGIGLGLLVVKLTLFSKKAALVDNRRVSTMLWVLLLMAVIGFVLNPNAPHFWLCIAYLFWLRAPSFLLQIQRKWLADLSLLVLLAALLFIPQLF